MKSLRDLNDLELIEKREKLKTSKIIDAILVGITIGISIYSAIKNGFGFSTFFPLIIGYLITKNSKNNKILGYEIQEEISHRNTK